jgi:nucleoside phosphorylase
MNMNTKKRLHEDYEVSSNVLVSLMLKSTNADQRRILLQDFLSKCRHVRPSVRFPLAYSALGSFVQPNIVKMMERFMHVKTSNKRSVDVVIVTVIPPELTAVQLALGIPPDHRYTRQVNGLRFWETELTRGNDLDPLTVAVTMIGQARNVSCAIGCDRAFNLYEVRSALLIGIAAGLKTKVKLGDVVAAESVLDYEYARLEPSGAKKRPTPYPLDVAMQRDMEHFMPLRTEWHSHIQESLVRLRALPDAKLPNSFSADWRPAYHTGVILAGEKLLADGSLPEMQKEFHDKVRAAEMEGAGFARSCREYGIPWSVFRGISDFGDPDKPPNDEWHQVAALSAATVAVEFLKSSFSRLEAPSWPNVV